MSTFSTWWNTMFIEEQIFWLIAIVGTLLLFIQIVLTFMGGDSSDMDANMDVDTSIETDTGIGFQFLSFKNFIAFFAIFGWTGILCYHSNLNMIWTVLIATLAGLFVMFLMALMMYGMHKLTEDGTTQLANAKGKNGSVYLTIPHNRSGIGQVQVKLNGLRTLDAVTDSDVDIRTGQFIEVIEVTNDFLIVKPK